MNTPIVAVFAMMMLFTMIILQAIFRDRPPSSQLTLRKLTITEDPSAPTDAVNRRYVDEQIADTYEQVDGVASVVGNVADSVSILRDDLSILQDDVVQLSLNSTDPGQVNAAVTDINARINTLSGTIDTRISTVTDRVAAAEGDTDQIDIRLTVTEGKIEEHAGHIATIDTALTDGLADHDTRIATVEAYGDHIEAIEADIVAHDGRMDDINAMLTTGLADHDTRIATVEAYGDHIETIEADITAHAGRMDDINTMLTDGLTDHDTRITTIESSINDAGGYAERISSVETAIDGHAGRMDGIIETLTDGPTNHETRITTIESSINDAGGYAERISSVETAIDGHAGRMDGIIETLTNGPTNHESRITAVEGAIVAYNGRITSVETNISAALNALDQQYAQLIHQHPNYITAQQAAAMAESSLSWQQRGMDYSGTSAAISAGGTVFAVGEFDTQTVVKIYKWDGEVWMLRDTINLANVNDGNSGVIKLSSDGSILAVGVQYPMAYELARVYAWDGISWSQRGNISGNTSYNTVASIATNADGSVVAVTYSHDGPPVRVQVFGWDGNAWILRGRMDPDSNAYVYGNSIAISADGSMVYIGTTLIGAVYDVLVRIYAWDSANFVQFGSDIVCLISNDYAAPYIATSTNGLTLAVGIPQYGENGSICVGRVDVYDFDGSSWVLRTNSIIGTNNYQFTGQTVSLSSDGTILAVGIPGLDDTVGMTKVYKWYGSDWVMRGSHITGKGQDMQTDTSISLNAGGNVLVTKGTSAIRVFAT